MKPSDVINAVRDLIWWNRSLLGSPGPTLDDPGYRAGFQDGAIAALGAIEDELRGSLSKGESTRRILERWASRKAMLSRGIAGRGRA